MKTVIVKKNKTVVKKQGTAKTAIAKKTTTVVKKTTHFSTKPAPLGCFIKPATFLVEEVTAAVKQFKKICAHRAPTAAEISMVYRMVTYMPSENHYEKDALEFSAKEALTNCAANLGGAQLVWSLSKKAKKETNRVRQWMFALPFDNEQQGMEFFAGLHGKEGAKVVDTIIDMHEQFMTAAGMQGEEAETEPEKPDDEPKKPAAKKLPHAVPKKPAAKKQPHAVKATEKTAEEQVTELEVARQLYAANGGDLEDKQAFAVYAASYFAWVELQKAQLRKTEGK